MLTVSPDCFIPQPKVGSAVIRLTRFLKPPVSVRDEAFLFQVIRASFLQRRKTLTNSLRQIASLSDRREDILAALTAMGLSPTIRGEALTLSQFAELSDRLSDESQA